VRVRIPVASHVIRVGNVEIMALTNGALEFDLCNSFPTVPEDHWQRDRPAIHQSSTRSCHFGRRQRRSCPGGRFVSADTIAPR